MHDLEQAILTFSRFAYAQMSLELSKLLWIYDMELVDQNLDFEAESGMFFQWRKPPLFVRFKSRSSS